MSEETSDAISQPPIESAASALRQKAWWLNTFRTCTSYAKFCVVPALVWTGVGLFTCSGSNLALTRLAGAAATSATGTPSIQEYLLDTVILLVTSVITLGCLAWGLGLWLMRLTAYCNAFLRMPLPELLSGSFTQEELRKEQMECIERTKDRKAYLAKFWFYVTLFLGFPFTVILILGGVKIGSTMKMYQDQALYSLPPAVDIAIIIVASLLILFVTEVSFIGLALSSCSRLEPMPAAKRTMSLSFKYLVPGCAITFVLLALNVIISSPQMLMSLNQADQIFVIKMDVLSQAVGDVWQGVTSLILWTFTTAPICELVRRHLD